MPEAKLLATIRFRVERIREVVAAQRQTAELARQIASLSWISKELRLDTFGMTNALQQAGISIGKTGQFYATGRRGALSYGDVINFLGKRFDSFSGVMGLQLPLWRGLIKQGVQWRTLGGRVAGRIRMLSHGMRGFRMELLSVMFFGMGIQKMFMGWLKPAMEAFGIFEMFRSMLLVLFIPIMEMLAPILYWIMELFMNLPEPIKLVIGAIAVAGIIFGGILAIVGALGLGVAGLVIAFGSLVALAPLILKMGLIFGGLVSAIAGIVLGVKYGGQVLDFFKDFGNRIAGIVEKIRGWIPKQFRGAFDTVAGLLGVFGDLLTGNWASAWAKISSTISTVLGYVKNVIIKVFTWIFTQLKGLPVIGDVIALFERIWNAIVNWIQEAGQISSIKGAIGFVLKTMGVPPETLSLLGDLWDTIVAFFTTSEKAEALKKAFGIILTLMGVPPEIRNFLGRFWDAVMGWLQSARNISSIEDAFTFIITGIKLWAVWGSYIAGMLIRGVAAGLRKLPVIGPALAKPFDWVSDSLVNFAQQTLKTAEKSKNLSEVIGGGTEIYLESIDATKKWQIAMKNAGTTMSGNLIPATKNLIPAIGNSTEKTENLTDAVSMGTQTYSQSIDTTRIWQNAMSNATNVMSSRMIPTIRDSTQSVNYSIYRVNRHSGTWRDYANVGNRSLSTVRGGLNNTIRTWGNYSSNASSSLLSVDRRLNSSRSWVYNYIRALNQIPRLIETWFRRYEITYRYVYYRWGGWGLQKGGIVTKPVLAMLGERGREAVIPLDQLKKEGGFGAKTEIYFSPTINITAEVGSEMDIREIADKLSDIWREDMRRMIGGLRA